MRSSTTSPRRFLTRPFLWLFVFATAAKVWLGPLQTVPIANAQIPDSAAQRNRLIGEVRTTNELLKQIQHTLQSATIKVRIVGADKPEEKAKVRRGR